jgi:hypothetical protein
VIALLATSLVVCLSGIVSAQNRASLFGDPVRDEASRAVPTQQLPAHLQPVVEQIVSNPTLYRHLPEQRIRSDRDMYAFLVRYPEVVVNIWQLMDVTKVQLDRTSPVAFTASDGVGTSTQVELIYSTPETQVFYTEGFYEGPLFRNRITGRGVMLLRSSFSKGAQGDEVTSTLDVFVRLDNIGAELVAKTFQRMVGKAADFNFVETAKFVGQVSLASEANGPGMQRLAANLQNVDPPIRDAFAQLTDVVYQRGLLRGPHQTPPENAYAGAANTASDPRNHQAGTVGQNPPTPAAEPAPARTRLPLFRR